MPSPRDSPILRRDTPFRGASFNLGNRLAGVLWQCNWLLLCRPTPAPLHDWRCLVLKAFRARIGRQYDVVPGCVNLGALKPRDG